MKIKFSMSRLGEASTSLSEASRLFGIPIGRKHIQRVAILRATEEFTQLYGHRALRWHPLKGSRAGQYAVSLTGNYRLIIEHVEKDIVRIVDVEDYHGD
ncbi:MAG: type II toxin-antitoxin system RelE/ParE family toxin [Chloroflexi bacterium]|nr:type II toxin-antitoxin system RelE/ParE family toxin [Chloroflexota bacterium]